MTLYRDIAARMDTIRSIFENTQLIASRCPDDQELISMLDQTDPLFISIAYEAASMSRALHDLESGDKLARWSSLAASAQVHQAQVHVGLGWALSRRDTDPLAILPHITPMMQARVLDGMGYSDGTFRQRTAVRGHRIPDYISPTLLHAYDQGMGRSLWYTARGISALLLTLVSAFDAQRQADLWRGVGIAVAYVGGCSSEDLSQLYRAADSHRHYLSVGALMALRTRTIARSPSADSLQAVSQWCRLDALSAQAFYDQTEASISDSADDPYLQLVTALAHRLASL